MKKLLFSFAVLFMIACTKESPSNYVNLGLSSGTLWNSQNEYNPEHKYGLYTYDEAINAFGEKIPSQAQWNELIEECEWTWMGRDKGYKIEGPNGKSIILPPDGRCSCEDKFGPTVGTEGDYWSSTPMTVDALYVLYFREDFHSCWTTGVPTCSHLSVRLVQ